MRSLDEDSRKTRTYALPMPQWGHASKVNSGRRIRNAPTGHCIPAQGNSLGPEDPTSRVLKERRIFRDRRPALFRCGVPSERIVLRPIPRVAPWAGMRRPVGAWSQAENRPLDSRCPKWGHVSKVNVGRWIADFPMGSCFQGESGLLNYGSSNGVMHPR